MQDIFAGAEVTLSFKDEERPGYFAIVNKDMKLAELGWIKFPKLMHLGWAAQWLKYEARLKANLSRPALEVPIFKEAVSPNSEGSFELCLIGPFLSNPIVFRKLMHQGWAAQWLQYKARLKANVSWPALEVPIFKDLVSQQIALLLPTASNAFPKATHIRT